MVVGTLPVKRFFLLLSIIGMFLPASIYSLGKPDKKDKTVYNRENVTQPGLVKESPVEEPAGEPVPENSRTVLAGTDKGLFTVDSSGKLTALWSGGSVKKILAVPAEENAWVLLSGEGIYISTDMHNWEQR
ncbi:MAG: hypothetical protein FWC24_03310, partial [Treponema sp.]|nr:hypothetical protein [Treponema sp.]